MADFTADVSRLQNLQAELQSLGARADGIAASVQSIGQSLGGIKSLANKGYPGKISTVHAAISKAAGGTKTGASRLGKITETYSNCEKSAKAAIQDSEASAAVRAKGGAAIASSLAKGPAILYSSLVSASGLKPDWLNIAANAWNDVLASIDEGWRKSGDILDDFRKWRSKEGSALVQAGISLFAGIPIIEGIAKNLADSYAKKWGKKAKKYEKMFDGVQASIDGFDHLEATGEVDVKSVDKAVEGFSAFASELGIPDFYAIKVKYEKRGDAINAEANRMLKAGKSKSEAYAYAISGNLLTIGELCVDTCVQGAKAAAKTTVKLTMPGVDKALEKIDAGFVALTGDTPEGHVDNILGGVGSSLRSGLKSFARKFR